MEEHERKDDDKTEEKLDEDTSAEKLIEGNSGKHGKKDKDSIKIKIPKIKFAGNTTDKLRKNPWIASTFVLLILAIVLLFITPSNITGNVVSANEAGQAVLDLFEQEFEGVELVEVNKMNGYYEVVLSVNSDEAAFYVTLDGRNLIELTPISILLPDSGEPAQNTGIPKSDKPNVELFVMSFCPYGTQAEKGLIPVVKLLGDTIDAKIRFVYYTMHDKIELDEQLKEYCIQEEQSDKYLNYLECFLEDGDSERCLTEIGIDKDAMNECVLRTDSRFKVTEKYNDDSTWLSGRYPLFDIDKELNEKYGIGGSPTLVVNGQVVQSGRSPAAYLDVICSAFNKAPAECGEELSSTTPNPMWGWDGSGADTQAQC